ncbi:MAG: LLM class flavin-dependent oxidoreductase, partial [Verrucomicrobiota bacterium]
WEKEEPEFHGEFFNFPPARFEPKPVQKPSIPILIGGESERALKRVAALGDGWSARVHTPESLRADLQKIHAMRKAAGLGYLLARTSDTLADTATIPTESRLACLDGFAQSVVRDVPLARWPVQVLNAVADASERHLLECAADLIDWLRRLPEGEASLVREVVKIIIGGQQLDLRRFADAENGRITALPDDAALDDYTWRVAGCVGAFWTKLGFLTLGGEFSTTPVSELIDLGVNYGKGLQLVNILRDLPADLVNGRCYLPVRDPHDSVSLLESHQQWLSRADEKIDAGFQYAKTLRSRRLRSASVLPAMIARETLALMRGADWSSLNARVKVSRQQVYLALLRAMVGRVG